MLRVNKLPVYTQLFSEGLLLFFFFVPLYVLQGEPLILWRIILLVVLAMVLFFGSLRWMESAMLYIVAGLLTITLAIGLLDIAPFIAFLFTGGFLWRGMTYAGSIGSRNQGTILLVLAFVFTIDSVFFYEPALVVMALLVISSLLGGYMASIIFADKTVHGKALLTYLGSFIGILIVGGALFYGAFYIIQPVVSLIWSGISQLAVMGAGMVARLVEAVGYDETVISNWVEQRDTNNVEMEFSNSNTDPATEQQQRENDGESDGGFTGWLIGIGIILLVGISLLLGKRKIKKQDVETDGAANSYAQVKMKKRPAFSKHFTATKDAPNQHIRKQVFQFEKAAHKKGIGRKPFETMEEWFQRLEVDFSKLELYQKVRYGEIPLTEEEIAVFETEFKEIASRLDIRLNRSI